jgi:hypothetical protein
MPEPSPSSSPPATRSPERIKANDRLSIEKEAQEEVDVIRVNTTLVTVPVSVRDPRILRKISLATIGSSGSGGGAGSSRADYDRGERYLLDLAESTGGRVYEAGKNLNYLRDAFSQIAEELGRQYTLG